MMLGPYPRSLSRIDGGVSAATTYVSQSLAGMPDIELIGVRIAGSASKPRNAENLGWPVVDLDLGRFSGSTLFRRQRRQLDALLARFKPDLVHAQGADTSGFLAVKCGYPAVVTIHGILSECAKLRTNPIKRMREQAHAHITEHYVVGRAAHVVAISPYVSRYYKNRLQGTIHDIPNAVAPQFFGLPRRPEPGRLLFAGRIARGKGLEDLVRAAAHAPDAARRVILAGSAPDRAFESRLLTAIGEAGQAHRFVTAGLLEEESLLDEFSRASALVLPSYQETAPMVIQQAMAAGLPVIATRVGGIPDQIEHDVSGLLFEPGDVCELAELMSRLHKINGLAQRLATAAKYRAVELFGADKVASATVAAYRNVLRRSPT